MIEFAAIKSLFIRLLRLMTAAPLGSSITNYLEYSGTIDAICLAVHDPIELVSITRFCQTLER